MDFWNITGYFLCACSATTFSISCTPVIPRAITKLGITPWSRGMSTQLPTGHCYSDPQRDFRFSRVKTNFLISSLPCLTRFSPCSASSLLESQTSIDPSVQGGNTEATLHSSFSLTPLSTLSWNYDNSAFNTSHWSAYLHILWATGF